MCRHHGEISPRWSSKIPPRLPRPPYSLEHCCCSLVVPGGSAHCGSLNRAFHGSYFFSARCTCCIGPATRLGQIPTRASILIRSGRSLSKAGPPTSRPAIQRFWDCPERRGATTWEVGLL